MAKRWIARVSNFRMPGSWGGRMGPHPGQLTLTCELSDAGKGVEGRSVDVVIPADHLETVAHMVSRAIQERDTARADAQKVGI